MKKNHINLNIPGKYNVLNALGSIGACINEGIKLDVVKSGLEKLKGCTRQMRTGNGWI